MLIHGAKSAQTSVGRKVARDSSRDIRVAVVDDHRLVLDGISSRLQSDRRIRVVASEPTWVGLLAHHEFPVDVVVLDLNLKDQIPIGAKLRTLASAGSRAVIMSSHADSTSIYTAMQAGAKGFVPKTDAADELVKAIQAAANNEQYENQPMKLAMAAVDRKHCPRLGQQEQRSLMLYAFGRSVKEVATAMGTTEDTVKSYIKRARRKYKSIGIDLGTKVLLRRQAITEGWLNPE